MPAAPALSVLAPALVSGLATTVGAAPFLFVRSVSRRFYDTLLGLGAGLMLAAATLGLLSRALEDVRPGGVLDPTRTVLVFLGFGLGVLMLRLMDGLIPHEHAGGHHVHMQDGHAHDAGHDLRAGHAPHAGHDLRAGHDHAHAHDHAHGHDHAHAHGHDHARAPGHDHAVVAAAGPHCDLDPSGTTESRTARAQGLLVVGVMFLHRVPEGLAIGAAWAGGGRGLGLLLASAVGVQNAVEGAVMAAPLRRGGLGPGALLGLVTATGLSVPLAALCGYLLSAHVTGALPPMLALAAGALLYLTCNEVIPESHSHGNEVRATFGLLSGFVVIMLLQVVFGHEH